MTYTPAKSAALEVEKVGKRTDSVNNPKTSKNGTVKPINDAVNE